MQLNNNQNKNQRKKKASIKDFFLLHGGCNAEGIIEKTNSLDWQVLQKANQTKYGIQQNYRNLRMDRKFLTGFCM
jgi:hypothetical protein